MSSAVFRSLQKMNTSRKVECNHHNTNTPPNSSNSEKQSCEKTQRKKRFSLSQQQQNSSITACVNDNPVSTNKRIVETDNDPLISSTHNCRSDRRLNSRPKHHSEKENSINFHNKKSNKTVEDVSSSSSEHEKEKSEDITHEEVANEDEEPPPEKVHAMFWRVMDWFDKTLDRMRDIFSDFRELSERIVPNPTATSTSDLHVPKEVVCPPDPHSTLQENQPSCFKRKRKHSELEDSHNSTETLSLKKKKRRKTPNNQSIKNEKHKKVKVKRKQKIKDHHNERHVKDSELHNKKQSASKNQQTTTSINDTRTSPFSYRQMLREVFLKYEKGTRQQILDWVYQMFGSHLNHDTVPGRKLAKWQKVMGNILRRDPTFREKNGIWYLAIDPSKNKTSTQNLLHNNG